MDHLSHPRRAWIPIRARDRREHRRRRRDDDPGGPGRALFAGLAVWLLLASTAGASDRPRYDVPEGFTRCPHATAWNGFFKWASVRGTSCRAARDFMRAYAREARRGAMPRRVRGFTCRIRYWRNEDGEVYASRHRCARERVIVRFYGMV